MLPLDVVLDEKRWSELDPPGILDRNTKAIGEPEIFDCAKAQCSEHGYSSVGAIGFQMFALEVGQYFDLERRGLDLSTTSPLHILRS